MSTTSREFRALVALASPIVVTQVTTMTMGVVDLLMVGHVSVDALGAVSLARLWIFGTMLLGMGVILGIDPIVTQAHGSRDNARLGIALQRGVVMALIVSIPLTGLWLVAGPALRLLGQSEELCGLAQQYVTAQLPSIPVFLLFTALRQYLQGRGIVRPVMYVAILSNVVNALADWVLIFGHLGLPALGVQGAGIAGVITRAFMLGGLLTLVLRYRLYEGGWVPWSRAAIAPRGLLEVFHYGLPVGLHMGLEVWAFEIATLMTGRLGNVSLAAHTVVLNMASLSFMVPLGISQAAVTRVGNLLGAGEPRRAQTAAWIAFALGAGVMIVSALVFLIFRFRLPGFYTPQTEVVALAATLLPIAGAFQIFDGTQVVGAGILRGMGRTRPAAVFNVIGYYGLGLPLAWWLGIRQGLGVTGIWWGLSVALATVALLLVIWVSKRGPAHATPIPASLPRH